MADADSLRRKSLAGLESLTDTDEQAYADAQYARMEGDLTRDYDQRTQATRENAFGRGLGLSTYLNDELAKQATAKSDALIRARREADLAARSATLAALGKAADAAQNDLARTAGATNADANRQLQARGQAQQRSIANNQMLASGLGSLGAAGLYGAAKGGAFKGAGGAVANGLNRLLGNGNGAPGTPTNGMAAMTDGLGGGSPASVNDFDLEGSALGSGGMYDGGGGLDSLSFSDFGSGEGDFGGFDPGAFFDPMDAFYGLDFGADLFDFSSLADWQGW